MSQLSEILNGYAFEMMRKGEYVQARRVLGQALKEDPNNRNALNNLASTFKALGREPEAIAIYERLIAEHPDFRPPLNNIAFSYLRHSRYADGWRFYMKRVAQKEIEHPRVNPITQRAFAIEPPAELDHLRGKHVYLVPEQGIGDELFFLRFTKLLQEVAQPASLWYAPSIKLYPIFRRFDFPVHACPMDWIGAPKENAVAVMLGDLPRILGHDGTWFPEHGKLAPSQLIEEPDEQPTIGVTWRAGNQELVHRGGIAKHIPPEALGKALSDCPGRVCIMQRNLQKNELAAFRKGFGERDGLEIFDSDPSPLRELAHIITKLESLSGYVGVSNTNMHLLAAMGRTARVLVLFPAEWRWPVTHADESPWFLGFKLYRQDVYGWEKAIDKLKGDLCSSTQ